MTSATNFGFCCTVHSRVFNLLFALFYLRLFICSRDPFFSAEIVTAAFEQPTIPDAEPVLVDRVDVKRGYCFVFLKDAKSQSDKKRIEEFVSKINGMYVSSAPAKLLHHHHRAAAAAAAVARIFHLCHRMS